MTRKTAMCLMIAMLATTLLVAATASPAWAADYTNNMLLQYRFDSAPTEDAPGSGKWYFANTGSVHYTNEGLCPLGQTSPLWSNGAITVTSPSTADPTKGDYVILTGSNQTVTSGRTALSISMWFKGDGVPSGDISWKFVGVANTYFFGARRSSGLDGMYFAVGIGTGTMQWTSAARSTTTVDALYDNQWHMATATYDNGVLKMYIDGQLEDTRSFTAANYTIANNTRQDRINSYTNPGDGGVIDTMMDDIRYYSVALTGQQVADIYAATVPEPATMTVLGAGALLVLLRRRR